MGEERFERRAGGLHLKQTGSEKKRGHLLSKTTMVACLQKQANSHQKQGVIIFEVKAFQTQAFLGRWRSLLTHLGQGVSFRKRLADIPWLSSLASLNTDAEIFCFP